MCYAIPGKVVELTEGVATIDYYGQRKKAYTDLTETSVGDYVYAQGGFVIQTVPETEALQILSDWKDLFFKLQETDKKLTNPPDKTVIRPGNPQYLYARANAVRQQTQGNSCCIHGILEFSNYCRNNCLYCGIRRDNNLLIRYRLDIPQILEAVRYAVDELGFKALVLQSGEDLWYDEEKLSNIVAEIRRRHPVLIFLSIGERAASIYQRLYESGARGVLLRFETSNRQLYSSMKPDSTFQERLGLINQLRQMGYLVITGFLVGLPGQNGREILENIKLTASLGADMFSFGPFIPHPQTPLAGSKAPAVSQMYKSIARARLMNPQAKILVTTALETLGGEKAARQALMSGANSLMINITPKEYRKLYDIYPNKFGTDLAITEHIRWVIQLLQSLGRAPTDLSI